MLEPSTRQPVMAAVTIRILCCAALALAGSVAAQVPLPPQPPEELAFPTSLPELVALYRQQVEGHDSGRRKTLAAIGELHDREAARFLAKVLQESEDLTDQLAAVSGLGASQQEIAFKTLAALAETQNRPITLTARAVTELGGFDTPDPTKVLRKLSFHQNISIARNAASALATRLQVVGIEAADRARLEKALLDIVSKGRDGYARSSALTALDRSVAVQADGSIDPKAWHKRLRKLIREERDALALAACIAALARRGDIADWTIVSAHCAHSSNQVRLAALKGLEVYERESEETQAYYLRALDDPDPRIRMAGFSGLGGSKAPRALEKATHAVLEDPVDTVRQAAGQFLAVSEAPRAVELLIRALASAVRPAEDETPALARRRESVATSLTRSLASAVRPDQIESMCRQATSATDPWTRMAALRALAQTEFPEADAALLATLQDGDVRVCLAAVTAVGDAGTPGGAAAVVEIARTRRVKEVVLRCIEALGKIGKDDESAQSYLVEAMSHNTHEVVLCAIDAAGRAQVATAVQRLAGLLTHDAWQYRSAAVGAMKRIRTKECIPPLIARLTTEAGKVKSEMLLALGHITGKDLGPDADLWQSWWAVVHEEFHVPTLEELAASAETTRAGGTYYGIPIVSERLTFVLDISCSMSASAQGDSGPSTRLEVAKSELTKVVQGLSRRALFNLIFFDNNISAWKRQLAPATSKIRSDAIKIVRRQQPRGGTNIYDAIEIAFSDPKVDTIYLLTDGQPGSGKFIDAGDIRREVGRMNRVRRITIHSIAIGAANDLLKNLAEDSGGVYVSH